MGNPAWDAGLGGLLIVIDQTGDSCKELFGVRPIDTEMTSIKRRYSTSVFICRSKTFFAVNNCVVFG